MGSGKPRGINAARKLHTHRRSQRWADKSYVKKHSGRQFRFDPLGGCSFASGICVGKVGIEAKQPNSAIRKGIRVLLKKNNKKITAFVPWDGCLNFIKENDNIMVAGMGRAGKSIGDIPGVRFKVVKVQSKGLLALFKGKQVLTNN